MKYPPVHYREADHDMSLRLIELFPLAMVVSTNESGIPDITFMPLIAEIQGNELYLLGHIDGNNPQVNNLEKGTLKVIFKGPDTYISPNDYISKKQLPTWNYAYVEVTGTCEFLSDSESGKLLVTMTDRLDSKNWKLEPEDERINHLVPYIKGFKIKVDSIVNRFKLSQDKTIDDQLVVNNVMKEDDRDIRFTNELKNLINQVK
ncbi:FMN-binding negative transcriptional regulator [Marinigracilibium pacificum]|uniref:FMN-binding negative transcriptional regulator n=1 Tax=Marinigracilibium pacificum TaxID=2729599 RepID=A0A848J0B9_9BACT|nr:FMN-binding negative transcriptional regulator [Marinigracilibium pacificum]NMM49997.1 FMN-binding negative transcriptional regulator [Marinigracilibium pacificum]